ncbi:MAG: SDR family oxidoreductase [Bacteroidales bacterium]|nr:SDR family oxidoreductase [Bacteroidales bacterium]
MQNKVVVITGATSGIGKALAYEFAGRGAKVVMGARTHGKLVEIAEDIKHKGGDVAYAQTDVTKEEDCKNLILTAIDVFGKIDILINNAGISMRALLEDVSIRVLKQLMDVNFWGTVYCTKYALAHILKEKGSIVAVSSIGGLIGLPGRTGYSASKFAINGFMESLRTENLNKNLHVLMAFPGFTTSNIRNTALSADGSPQGESPREEEKMMTAEQVAREIYSAISKRKNKLVLTTLGKSMVLVNKYFPAWLSKRVFKTMAKEPGSPFR